MIWNGGPNPRSQSYTDPGLGISVKKIEILRIDIKIVQMNVIFAISLENLYFS